MQGIEIQNGPKMKHSCGVLSGCYDILSQQIRQIQDYHRKSYCDFNIQKCYASQQKNHFLSYKVANNNFFGSFPNSHI